MSMPLFPMLQPVLLPPLAPLDTTQWPRGTLPAADNFFIRPTAQGNRDGTSWANALAFADIPRCLASLNADGEILLAAWDGAFSVSSPVVLSRSLLVGAATIRGAALDNSPAKATINGTRVPWSTTNYAVGTPENGYDVFCIADGTSGLTISFFNFTNVQRGVLFLANADTIQLSDLDAANVFMLWDAERDVGGHFVTVDAYTISNLTCERLSAIGYELGVFNSVATMPGFVATDIYGDSQGYYGSSFTEGIHLGGTVESPVFTRMYCHNSFYSSRGQGGYWNGDGLCTEHGVNNAVWTDVGGNGNDDAGIDVKAENETYNGGLVARNKKNFKTWSTTGGTINDLISVNPVKNGGTDTTQHYLFAGSGGDPVWNINRPIIRSDIGNTSPLFRNEKTVGSVTVNIDSWLQTKTATTLSITGTDTLNDSDNDLGGIKVETPLWLTGCANTANNNVPLHVTASAAGALTLARMDGTPAALTNEAAGASITVHWGIIVDPATVPVTTNGAVPFTLNWTNPGLPTISSFTLNWRSGMEAGFIDEATSVGSVLGDLSLVASNMNTVLAAIISDPDSKCQLSADGTQLQLKAALDPAAKTSHTGTIRVYDITGLAHQDLSFTIYVNATTLDTDTAAFDTALQAASLPYLTDGTRRRWRATYDNLVREIKRYNSGALWGYLDGLIVLISYDVGVAKRNLRQNAAHATFTGTTDWVAKRSWKGNGVDAKIDIAYNPTTFPSAKFVQNDAHLGIVVISNVDETAIDFSVDTTTRSWLRTRSGGSFSVSVNATSSQTSSISTGIVHIAGSRISSSQFRYFVNATSGGKSQSSVAPTNANLVAGRNSATGGYTIQEYALLHWGRGFQGDAADMSALRAAWAQYKAMAALAE